MPCCGEKSVDVDEETQKKPKRCTKLVQCLFTCCVLWFVVSGVLIAALVFIGKHIVYNSETGTFSRYKPNFGQNSTDGILTKPKDTSDLQTDRNNGVVNATKNSLIPNDEIYKITETLPEAQKLRLPKDTRPIFYNLTLLPFLEKDNFDGHLNITLEVFKTRENIILNSQNLLIKSVTLTRENDKKLMPILTVNEDEKEQQLILVPKEKVNPGKYLLDISFQGKLEHSLTGLYKSVYKNQNGTTRTIATSKFEPTYARQAFPCFDEPNMKAKYKVHLLKPKEEGYIALSNYPVEKTTTYDENNDLVTFEETVAMSTYLTCFIVSDFIHTDTAFNNGGDGSQQVPLKVYASPGNLEKITYATDVTKKVIEYYVKYFGIPYPLQKLDLVAIPDFVSGAMENWGLITYRETSLLYTKSTHSSRNKQSVVRTIAHELAHSWFGNLVTMDWWNDLWLNEGFATYISYKGIDEAETDFKMMSQFQLIELIPVLNYDCGLSSHPIVVEVNSPDEITSIFDNISYNKGASLLRMLENMVGEYNFQKGVTNYLKKYAFGNAVTQNFLDEIQNVVGPSINVLDIMDTFTVQMGYPVINVAYNESSKSFTLTQTRFLRDPNASFNATDSKYRYKWSVPITYVTNLGKSEIIVFPYSQEKITIKKPENSTWFKLNSNQTGYYRVSYDETLWQNLINSYNELNVYDRTHLLDDAFSIASAGQLNYSVPLELTKHLTNELDYAPWNVASTRLLRILQYLNSSSSSQEQAFKTYIQRIITNAYENLTWNETTEDPHIKRLTRVKVLHTACKVDHEQCLAEVAQKFDAWISDPTTPLSQDLRPIIYSFGMQNASDETWNKLLDIYIKERDASEKGQLMRGLASVRNSTILKKLLELAKNESVVRGQDYFTLLTNIANNPSGTQLVWDFVREEWDYLVKRFTLNERKMGAFIPTLAKRFSTAENLAEFKAFFEKYPEAGAGARGREMAIENIENNIRWLESFKIPVEIWIESAVNES